jgi:hypothetical protein
MSSRQAGETTSPQIAVPLNQRLRGCIYARAPRPPKQTEIAPGSDGGTSAWGGWLIEQAQPGQQGSAAACSSAAADKQPRRLSSKSTRPSGDQRLREMTAFA